MLASLHSSSFQPLAHPLDQPGGLPFSSLVATSAVLSAIVVASFWRRGAGVILAEDAVRSTASWRGPLTPPQWGVRAGAATLTILAVAAGRLGSVDELDNLAPALVVGAAWPLLVLVSAVGGPIWRWIDPWDTGARALGAPEEDEKDVRAAAVAALGWVWYLNAYPHTLNPRAVGTALGLYSIVTVAACLVLGRGRWLGGGEVFGLLFTWTALLPQRRLSAWRPPRGAELVLGILAGGLLFGAVEQTALWGPLAVSPSATAFALAGVVGASLLGGVLLNRLGRWERRLGGEGGVAAACVPAVASIAVALAMTRNRLFTSIQLLPGLLGDPFGLGWNLLGEASSGIDPEPLGTTGRLVAQVLVVMAGHGVGGLVIAHRTAVARRVPAFVALASLAVVSTLTLGDA